ncbi:MAG: VanZ family protein [Thiohalorhabdus sp.]|uniref:VanZ family protein n=1 Tax=Thiohalorhabdus sp. TaxID=3094134 RepID=UPI0039802B9E
MRAVLWPSLYMALLFVLSSIPGTAAPEDGAVLKAFTWVPPTLQNFLHLPAYGLLAWLWLRPLTALPLGPKGIAGTAWILAMAYGVFDEWHQSWVPGRYPSATDLAVDGLGALTAVGLYLVLQPRRLTP